MLSERPVGSLALRRRRNFSVDVTESAGLLQVEGIPSVVYPNMQSCIARLSATIEKRHNPTPESHCGAAANGPQGPRRIAGRGPVRPDRPCRPCKTVQTGQTGQAEGKGPSGATFPRATDTRTASEWHGTDKI
jgi:hypothetical protein